MARLEAFLAASEARSFRDGDWDCALMVAAWVQSVTALDGAAPWRGRYRTALGWARILKREGGIISVVGRGASLVGLPETDMPQRGDIGVVPAPDGETAAIYLGRLWAVADANTGWRAIRADCLKAWRVSCPDT